MNGQFYYSNASEAEQWAANHLGTFITKDSGERAEYSTGMVRDTQKDKPRFDLLLIEDLTYESQPLTRWANLMARGAEKYSARNWELAHTREELERFQASALRHLMQALAGEDDEDHLAAVLFNVSGIMMLQARGIE